MRKPRATPDMRFVLHPERDADYVHFQNGERHPFDARATVIGRCNAWWLADAALLAYWDAPVACARFEAAGWRTECLDQEGVQCYVATASAAVIVAFRGTEPDQWRDIFDDASFALAPWVRAGTLVHRGFRDALQRIWDRLHAKLVPLAATRSVWFTGHSLGAALATLAADRADFDGFVCTLGSPRVGDHAFTAAFDRRFRGRSLRYVSGADVVTHVPPPLPLPYDHVARQRHIREDGTIGDEPPRLHHFFNELIRHSTALLDTVELLERGLARSAPGFLLDHMPRGYSVDIWNDHVDSGER
jgi:hypothetical protein